MKHRKPEEMEIGLNSLLELVSKISQEKSVCTPFFENFYTLILKETFSVMTDCFHMSGFKLQVKIIQNLLQIIERNLVEVALKLNPGDQSHSSPSNKDFVMQFIKQFTQQEFPNLNEAQLEAYIMQMFNNCEDWKAFKSTLRDFMISLRSFANT
jgi:exportin-1